MFSQFISLVSRFAAVTFPPCALKPGGSFLGLPTWYKYLDGQVVAGKCTPVFIFPNDIGKILMAVVEILLRIVAMIAVGYVIYGGFRLITSQGEPEHTNAARTTILNALIGLVIALFAIGIVSLVFNSLAR